MSDGPKTLGVVGLGLLGASIAETTRKRHPDWKIVGVSSSITIKEALASKLIDEGVDYPDARNILEQCDLILLCTPIDNILGLLKVWTEKPLNLKPGTVISDVGSTKSIICAYGKKAFPAESNGTFIGSHPMAGSEKTGIKARDAHLFENAAWILCPEKDDSDKIKSALSILEKFVQGLGARTLTLAPAVHDILVADASHLPQLLATVLASSTGQYDRWPKVLEIAGGGFRDMTRLAASSFAVWEPILRTNKDFILDAMKSYRAELESVEVALEESEGAEGLAPIFSEANTLRSQFNAPRKGFSSPTTEILIDLEDKPGALLHALSPLSAAGLNILDLEILKVREGEEGTLMMGFHKPEEAQTALDLLAKSGHKARLR